MIKTLLPTLLICAAPFTHAYQLSINENSSWDEILSTPNIDVTGDDILVGNTRTTVFNTVHDDTMIYTKTPTQNGYYDLSYVGSDVGIPFVPTDKSIKSGNISVQVPVYKYNYDFVGSNYGMTGEIVDYKTVEQPLKRTLRVYQAREPGQMGNVVSRKFLFEKEYTIPMKKEM